MKIAFMGDSIFAWAPLTETFAERDEESYVEALNFGDCGKTNINYDKSFIKNKNIDQIHYPYLSTEKFK